MVFHWWNAGVPWVEQWVFHGWNRNDDEIMKWAMRGPVSCAAVKDAFGAAWRWPAAIPDCAARPRACSLC